MNNAQHFASMEHSEKEVNQEEPNDEMEVQIPAKDEADTILRPPHTEREDSCSTHRIKIESPDEKGLNWPLEYNNEEFSCPEGAIGAKEVASLEGSGSTATKLSEKNGKQPIVSPCQETTGAHLVRTHVPLSVPAPHNGSHVLARLSLPDGCRLHVVTEDRIQDGKKETYVDRSRMKLPFAVIVHMMLSEVSVTNPKIMRWVSDGEAFAVDQKHPGLGPVLAKYFHHSKYTSFQRQLNTYGWSKCRQGRDRGSHEHLSKIQRKVTDNTSKVRPRRKRSVASAQKKSPKPSNGSKLSPGEKVGTARDTQLYAGSQPKKDRKRNVRESSCEMQTPGTSRGFDPIKSKVPHCSVLQGMSNTPTRRTCSRFTEPDMGRLVTHTNGHKHKGVTSSVPAFSKSYSAESSFVGKSWDTITPLATADSDTSGHKWGKKSLLSLQKPSQRKKKLRRGNKSESSNSTPTTPTSFHNASSSPGFMEKDGITSSTDMQLLEDFPTTCGNDQAAASPTTLLINQPLIRCSPEKSTRSTENCFLPLYPQPSPSGRDALTPLYIPFVGVHAEPFPADVASGKAKGAIPLTPKRSRSGVHAHLPKDRYKSPLHYQPSTYNGEPIAVRVRFARGQTAQLSPMVYRSKAPPSSTVSIEASESSSSIFSQSPAKVQRMNHPAHNHTKGVTPSKTTSLQGKTELTNCNTMSKRVGSPLALVPASVSSISRRTQSPSYISTFLGWTSELSYALDLSDCLDDCNRTQV